MGHLRTLLATSALILALICAAAGLLALGGAFSARLDALTHLAPVFVGLAALAAAAALVRRGGIRRTTFAAAAVAGLAGGLLMAPEFLRSDGPHAPAEAPGQIKVIQFNASQANRELPRVVDWLVSEQPDIVTMEEPTPYLRDLIVARTGWSVAGYATTVMIFSRAPYLVMHRPTLERGTPLLWVNATYASSSGPFEVMVTHFTWPTQSMQAEQSLAMRKLLKRLPRARMILGGDFNSTPWSFIRRADDRDFGLVRRDRALASWPARAPGPGGPIAPFPVMPIDHVYAGSGWATTSIRRGPRLGSDHYPLVVTFAPVAPR